jgi:hypothetical protein
LRGENLVDKRGPLKNTGDKGMDMASEGNMESATQTYTGFVALVKWGTIASVIVAAIVVLLISS